MGFGFVVGARQVEHAASDMVYTGRAGRTHLLAELCQSRSAGARQLYIRVVDHNVAEHLCGVQVLIPAPASVQLIRRPPAIRVLSL